MGFRLEVNLPAPDPRRAHDPAPGCWCEPIPATVPIYAPNGYPTGDQMRVFVHSDLNGPEPRTIPAVFLGPDGVEVGRIP